MLKLINSANKMLLHKVSQIRGQYSR